MFLQITFEVEGGGTRIDSFDLRDYRFTCEGGAILLYREELRPERGFRNWLEFIVK